jgi:DivIVA domain-containing protein
MGSFLLVLAVVLVIAALVFGVVALISGEDPGLSNAEPDGRAVPLPNDRPLGESDLVDVRFDTGVRGYRMEQVDRALRRTAYDLGYKEEMIGVLEAEVAALREGRLEEADQLRQARESAAPATESAPGSVPGSAPEPAPEPAPESAPEESVDESTRTRG